MMPARRALRSGIAIAARRGPRPAQPGHARHKTHSPAQHRTWTQIRLHV